MGMAMHGERIRPATSIAFCIRRPDITGVANSAYFDLDIDETTMLSEAHDHDRVNDMGLRRFSQTVTL